LLTGGVTREELRQAGASGSFASIHELRGDLGDVERAAVPPRG